MFIPHPVALGANEAPEKFRPLCCDSKPVDAFLKGRWDPGFKFSPVEYDNIFEDY